MQSCVTNKTLPLEQSISRGLPVGSPLTKSLPQTNELSYSCPPSTTYQSAAGTLSDFLSKLDLRVSPLEENQRTFVCRVQAAYASWTRAARRGRHGREVPPTEKGHAILLACDLALDLVEKDNKALVQFKAVWVRGLDRQAFESFFSSCVRKLASAKPVLSRQMVPDTSRKRKREAE